MENSEIVNGYEYSKGRYLIIEPSEIENLRIETRNVIDVQQFAKLEEIPLAFFEKPYFVVPEPKESPEAFVIVRQAMERTKMAAVGEIAFGGREHLVAVTIPSNESAPGMMAYALRYGQELRKEIDYFSQIPTLRKQDADKKQLAMATQLIEAYSHPFAPDAFHDDYEAALRELIEAKQENVPLPVEEERPKPTKVIDLMDALRQSVSKAKKPVASERRGAKSALRKGPVLMSGNKHKHRAA